MASERKNGHIIIGVSVLAAIIFWAADTVVDYSYHSESGFAGPLFFDLAEASFRSAASFFIIACGIFVARAFAKQKRTEERLRKAEEHLKTIIESEPECVKLVARDGTLTHMNRAGLDMIEADSLEQVKGRNVYLLIAPEYRGAFDSMTERVFAGFPGTLEFEVVGLKGRRLWLETHAVPLRDEKGDIVSSLAITRNVTERKQAECRVMSALREKEVLLKEIHHRVKNNLQVVASILGLQAEQITDIRTRMFFEESQRRVEAMSLIHESLYRSGDLSRIDFREYVEDLVAGIVALQTGRAGRVDIGVDIGGITMDVNRAIPCGLIINELVSNVFKHAFRDGRHGSLRIHMAAAGESISLVVSDNGVGFPAGIDFRNTKSLGMQLVMALVRQLDGTIDLEAGAGTVFRLNFPGRNYSGEE